eukprot:scaffold93311_cov31-Tisochrysis_lutea.AAC.5
MVSFTASLCTRTRVGALTVKKWRSCPSPGADKVISGPLSHDTRFPRDPSALSGARPSSGA